MSDGGGDEAMDTTQDSSEEPGKQSDAVTEGQNGKRNKRINLCWYLGCLKWREE